MPTATSKNTGLTGSLAQDSGNRLRLVIAGLASIAVLAVLYFVWPYQHGHLGHRTSVLGGLYVLVSHPVGREWIFCLFVPFIAGFLVYLQRHTLKGLPIRGSSWAVAPFLVSIALFWLGYKADTRFLGFASAQIMIAALIIWFLGWDWMKSLLFPWLFLAFMWPFPPLEEIMAFPLRIFAAQSSTAILNLFGIDCVREGTAIISQPDLARGLERGELFQLDVDQPCSGIRSLFSLMMISAFYGYISLAKSWQRWVIFASAIPLAVLGNIVRMLLLAGGCIAFGTEFAVGTGSPSTYHELSGIAVFVVALFGMFSLSQLLERHNPLTRKKKKTGRAPAAASSTAMAQGVPYWRSCVALALGALILLACFFTPTAKVLSAPSVALSLPVQLGQYWGYPMPMTKKERDGLGPDVALARMRYESASGQSTTATVVVGGPEERTLHRPEVCFPGQGWKVVDSSVIPVTLGPGSELRATLLTLMRSEQGPDGAVFRRKAFNIYWYVGKEIYTPDYHRHLMISLYDNMFKNLNHRWSMVSIFSVLPAMIAEDPLVDEEALTMMREHIAKIVPQIKAGSWE